MSRKPPAQRDFTASCGAAAIGARLRRLSERIDREADSIYKDMRIDFEQRWFGVVNLLNLYGAQSVGELAAALGISHAAVSQTRAALAQRGLIGSEADSDDGRRRTLSLTLSGRRLAARLAPIWAALNEAGRDLDREAGAAIDVLERLEVALDGKSLISRVRDRLGAR